MSPRESVVPIYMPGRLRTASRPSRTARSLAVYWFSEETSLLLLVATGAEAISQGAKCSPLRAVCAAFSRWELRWR